MKKETKLKKIVEDAVKDKFDEVRMQGVWTGWYAHASRCVAKIKDCKTVDEAIEILNKDVKMVEEKLHLKESNDGTRDGD